jgi:hypothetical protein
MDALNIVRAAQSLCFVDNTRMHLRHIRPCHRNKAEGRSQRGPRADENESRGARRHPNRSRHHDSLSGRSAGRDAIAPEPNVIQLLQTVSRNRHIGKRNTPSKG